MTFFLARLWLETDCFPLDHITSGASNFETVLSLLSSFFVPEDENVLLTWIEKTLGDKKLRAMMKRWRLEWRELVITGKSTEALL